MNNFPLLLLGGSIETHLVTKGRSQEIDSITLLTSLTKTALRPPNAHLLPSMLTNAFRTSFYVEAPADIINDPLDAQALEDVRVVVRTSDPPKGCADDEMLSKTAALIKTAEAPLNVIAKGAAYARAETAIRALVDQTGIPFLPSPMSKGVVADSHQQNESSITRRCWPSSETAIEISPRLVLHTG